MARAGITIVIIAAVMVVSGYTSVPHPPRHNIVIAVNADEETTITVDGRPVTCPAFNATLAIETPKAKPLDCALMAARDGSASRSKAGELNWLVPLIGGSIAMLVFVYRRKVMSLIRRLGRSS